LPLGTYVIRDNRYELAPWVESRVWVEADAESTEVVVGFAVELI
jgi:hypothetical protein